MITPGDRSLAINFTVPTNNGGSAITRYEYDLDNNQLWSTLDAAAGNTVSFITNGGFASTIAGQPGIKGTSEGTIASFGAMAGVAVDNVSNVYVADFENHTIRRISPTGVTSTIAGTAGVAGRADLIGQAASFNNPVGLALDASFQNLYVADAGNHTIRKIVLATGSVSTLAGFAGSSGNLDAPAGSNARFNYPAGLAFYASGGSFLLVADRDNHRIRKINVTSTEVSHFSGSTTGQPGSVESTAAASVRYNSPLGIACNSSGTVVIVADYGNNTIRKITSLGTSTSTTVFSGAAGVKNSTDGTLTQARYSSPSGVALDSAENIYVTDSGNQLIRKIGPSSVITLAGLVGVVAHADGAGSAANFYEPYGVASTTAGKLYVTDRGNYVVREISSPGAQLTNGTTYAINIRAVNAGGPGLASNTARGTPGAGPSVLRDIKVLPADKSLILTYQPPLSNGGYPILRYEYAIKLAAAPWGTVNYITLPTNDIIVSTTSPALTPLVNNSAYHLRVRAVNQVGAGVVFDSSTIPTTYTPSTTPAAVTYTLTPDNNSFALSLIVPAVGIAGVVRHEYSVGESGVWSILDNATKKITNTYLADAISGKPSIGPALVNGNNYNVRLRAVNLSGPGPETVKLNVSPGKQADAPTALVATAFGDYINLAFTPPANTGGAAIASYEYSAVTPITAPDKWLPRNDFGVGINNTTSPIKISGLTQNTTYLVKLRAVVGSPVFPTGLAGTLSPNVTTASPPSVVRNLAPVAGHQKIVVKFDAPSSIGSASISSYKYILNNITLNTQSAITSTAASGTPLQFTIAGLTNGSNYSVTLWAVNNANLEGARTTSSTITVNDYKPTATLGAITTTLGNLTFRFSASTDSALGSLIASYSYRVYLSSNSANPPAWTTTAITQVASITNQAITSAQSAGAYLVDVKVTTASGLDSDTVTSAQTSVSSAPSQMQAPLVENAPGYNYASTLPGATGALRVLVTRPGLVSDTDGGNSAVQKYTVRPYIGAVAQASIEVYATAAPTGPNYTMTQGTVAGSAGYYIDISAANFTGFTLGSTYTFKVFATNALNAAGTESNPSASIVAIAPMIKNALPTLTAPAANTTSPFTLSFNASPNATGTQTFYRRGTTLTGYSYKVYQKNTEVASGTAAAADAPANISLTISPTTIRQGLTTKVDVVARYQGYASLPATTLTTIDVAADSVSATPTAPFLNPSGYAIISAVLGSYNVTLSTNTINLTWTIGSPNADTTAYEYSLDGGTNWVALPDWNLTTTNIVSNLQYKASGTVIGTGAAPSGTSIIPRLRAVRGVTAYAAAVSPQTVVIPVEAKPAAPTSVVFSPVSNKGNCLRVTAFTAGGDGGAPILNYRVNLTWAASTDLSVAAGSKDITVSATNMAVNYDIVDAVIPNGVNITAKVYVTNRVGESTSFLTVNNVYSAFIPPAAVSTVTSLSPNNDPDVATLPAAITDQFPPTINFTVPANGTHTTVSSITYQIKRGTTVLTAEWTATAAAAAGTAKLLDSGSLDLANNYEVQFTTKYTAALGATTYASKSAWIVVPKAVPNLPYAGRDLGITNRNMIGLMMTAVAEAGYPSATRNKVNGSALTQKSVIFTPYTTLTGGIPIPDIGARTLNMTSVSLLTARTLIFKDAFEGSNTSPGSAVSFAGTGTLGLTVDTRTRDLSKFAFTSYPVYAPSPRNKTYLVEPGNCCVRVLDMAVDQVTTLVGPGTLSLSRRMMGYCNATAENSLFFGPIGGTIVGNYLYVADTFNHCIRRVDLDTKVTTTLAGAAPVATEYAVTGTTNGTTFTLGTTVAIAAGINNQSSPVNGIGNERAIHISYVEGANTLINPLSTYCTLATGNYLQAGSTYTINQNIAAYTNKAMKLVFYRGESGNADGIGTLARFNQPKSPTTDGTSLYVVDAAGGRTIRKIRLSDNSVSTIAGNAGTAGTADGSALTTARFTTSEALVYRAVDNSLIIADNYAIRKLDLSSNNVSTLAGVTGTPGYVGNGASSVGGTKGSDARFRSIWGLSISPNTYTVFIADTYNHTIRRMAYDDAGNNFVYDIAGGRGAGATGYSTSSGDAARFFMPSGIAYISEGRLLVTDSENYRIRSVTYYGESGFNKEYFYDIKIKNTNSIGTSAEYTLPVRQKPTA